jgi:hypothetical protein
MMSPNHIHNSILKLVYDLFYQFSQKVIPHNFLIPQRFLILIKTSKEFSLANRFFYYQKKIGYLSILF